MSDVSVQAVRLLRRANQCRTHHVGGDEQTRGTLVVDFNLERATSAYLWHPDIAGGVACLVRSDKRALKREAINWLSVLIRRALGLIDRGS